MDHSTSLKRVIFLIAAIAFFFTSSVELRAQSSKPYVRGVLIEEFTGTWCGYCPNGAWYMDSLQEYLGDNVVEICWHNNDEMTAQLMPSPKSQDTAEGYFGVQGYPNIGVMRNGAVGVSDWSGPGEQNVQILKKAAQTAPIVDFRIVNVAYDPASNSFSADLDITPFDMKKMPSDDIAKYVTLGVITEDNLDYDQHNYSLRNLPSYISPFLHHNVARSVSGSVMGNKFTLGTKVANQSLPVRIHYSFGVDNTWNAGNLRFKSMVDGITDTTISSKKYQVNHVYNAAQTKYFVSYPQSAPDAMWIVLPNANSTTSPSAPTNIVWARGGNAGQNAKLEYSIDDGKTWVLIVASTSASPYAWTIPQAAYGGMAKIRITDAGAPNTKSISEAIKTPGIIKLITPAKDEVIQGGTSDYKVTFSGGNLKSPFRAEYSLDNGATWTSAGSGLSNVDAREYHWFNVPNPTADVNQAMFRITDGNAVVGTSEVFQIKAVINKGAITSVKLDPYPSDDQYDNNENIVVNWTSSGDLGNGVDVYLSTESGIIDTWVKKNTDGVVTPEKTSYTFKAPAGFHDNSCVVKVQMNSDASISAKSTQGPNGFFTIGKATQGGVYSSTPKNGYSVSNNPNPASNETSFRFTLPVRGLVSITILDNLGRKIDQVVTENYDAGTYSINYNAANLSNGVYTYTLESGSTKLSGKLTIVK